MDVDVSGDGVPAGATGVILRLHNPDSSGKIMAVRKNGSTDTRTPSVRTENHTGAMVGIDASRLFEAYVGATTTTSPKLMLIGYTTDSTDFFTNSVDKTPASTDGVTWYDIDVSGVGEAPAGAVGVLVEWQNTSGATNTAGIRKNGSTDTFTYGNEANTNHFYQACGVDASRIFEARLSHIGMKLWVIGYFMAPIEFETNAISYALGGTGTWTNISVTGGASPATADGALWLIRNGATGPRSAGTRKEGSTDESYGGEQTSGVSAYFTGLDGSRVAEGKIQGLLSDHYVIGYAKPAAGAAARRMFVVS